MKNCANTYVNNDYNNQVNSTLKMKKKIIDGHKDKISYRADV